MQLTYQTPWGAGGGGAAMRAQSSFSSEVDDLAGLRANKTQPHCWGQHSSSLRSSQKEPGGKSTMCVESVGTDAEHLVILPVLGAKQAKRGTWVNAGCAIEE
jgi:hypothetical protein